MKNILIFLFICFGFALNSQITITCYECKKNTTVDCKGCNIQSNLFTGIVIKEKGKPDIPLYEPYKVSNKSSVFTFEDAFGTKTIVNVTSVLSYNTPKKLYDYLSNCLCKPSTIDTDTDRYSVLIQDSILVTYDINGVEIDRDTIRLFDIDTDTKTFLVQDSILVYYDIQNNEIGRDTIKIPFVDTDIQTYLTQDSILVYYDESNTEIGRDTIRIPSIASITEQGDFRISNDTLYHNNSIDGIEQFVKLPSIDTTTQSYLPVLNGLDTIGYENITYLGGVEVDRDTITLPKEIITNITNTVTGHKIADYTNENGTIQPINETITNLYSVSGGSGAPDTLKYTNETGITTNVSPIIYGARHDLRLTSPIIERGSDSATDPKGAQFLHDGYSHLNGYSDSWVSTTLGANRPVVKLWNSGKVEFNTNNNHANDFSFVYKDNSNILNGLGNTVNAFSVSVILNGYSNTNTNPNSYSIVSGTSNILNSSNSVMAGAFNNSENSTSTGIFGTGNTAFNSTSAFMSGSFNFLSNSVNSFVSGASINILNSKYCFAAGQQGNIYGDLSSILGYGLNTSSLNHTKIGFTTVPWLGQNLIKWVSSDVHFEISRGNQLDGSANIYETSGSAQNSVTLLKSGLIQFNSDLINNSHTQNDVTPISALEIVSTTKGVTIPRLTSAQISAWQASFNTTTDVTGLSGAGDEKHSRQGEMVYDLSTSLNTQARWNGTSWVFVTW
jgi:hypothetical protein